MKKNLLLFSFLFLFFSCKPKDTFSWNAGLSGPENYPSGAPFVGFYYQGEGLGGASSGTGAGNGWGVTSGGYVGGDKYKPVPDSIFLRWVCSVDNLVYEEGFKLPREKMLALFKKGLYKNDGTKIEYGTIVAGMAPGGNVTVWMQGGGGYNTEIAKFKVSQGREDPNIDEDYIKKSPDSWGNYLRYWKIHGIPYAVWEHGEKEYDYDIGFASEDAALKPSIVTFYSKDGSWFQPGYHNGAFAQIDRLDYNIFKYTPNNNIEKKHKLPVQIKFKYKNNGHYYIANIVMPNDFSKYFTDLNYDRITIGLNKGGEYGIIWVEGKQGRLEVMKFKVFEIIDDDIKNSYSLPKGFVFPKWEGSEPLHFPEIEFWQEE